LIQTTKGPYSARIDYIEQEDNMQFTIHRQSVIQFYGYFALGLAFLFLGFYLFEERIGWWQADAPKMLPIILGGYLALAVVILQFANKDRPFLLDSLLPYQMLEILIMGLLMIYIAPKQQDLALLMLFPVGIGNLLVSKRFGYLLAAMATIMVLTQGFLHPHNVTDRVVSGSIIGISYFLEALIIQSLSSSLSEAKHQAQQAQVELDNAAKLNDLIIERMHTGVCVVDHHGAIIRINRAAQERLENLQPNQCVPQSIMERMHYWMKFDLQKESEIQLDPSNPSSSVFVFFARIDEANTLIFIENKETVVRKAHQSKLDSLARMAASIAHEIRNPLNAVSHATQLLLENPELSKEDQHLGGIILRHCTRMDNIVQNVMQISKRTTSDLQWIQLNKWLGDLIPELCEQYQCKIFITGDPIEIRFDPSQLQQVISNLSQNATRYGGADKDHAIEIQLKQANQRGCLSFIDQGPGLSEQAVQYLYEPFHSTSASGTGLGLYLIKELCEANHAEVRYDSQHEQGAKFDIYFAHDAVTNKD